MPPGSSRSWVSFAGSYPNKAEEGVRSPTCDGHRKPRENGNHAFLPVGEGRRWKAEGRRKNEETPKWEDFCGCGPLTFRPEWQVPLPTPGAGHISGGLQLSPRGDTPNFHALAQDGGNALQPDQVVGLDCGFFEVRDELRFDPEPPRESSLSQPSLFAQRQNLAPEVILQARLLQSRAAPGLASIKSLFQDFDSVRGRSACVCHKSNQLCAVPFGRRQEVQPAEPREFNFPRRH